MRKTSLVGARFPRPLWSVSLILKSTINEDAKRELINLIFHENSERKDKSHAYYLLGAIAFDENRIRTATKTWGYIVEEYPDSDEALMVKERINELSKGTLSVYTESIETADYSVAKLYLENANFWSKEKDDKWIIDSSWIPKVEFALKWEGFRLNNDIRFSLILFTKKI